MCQTGTLLIKEAEEEDLPALAEMLFDSKLGKTYYPTLDMLLTLMKQAYRKDCFFVLQNGTEKIGFIWFQRRGAFHTYPYLHLIFVKTEYQGQGYGMRLLEFLEQDALCFEGKKFRTKVFLTVGSWNTNAMQFYEHAGYQTLCTIPGLFRKKVDEYFMVKECIGT